MEEVRSWLRDGIGVSLGGMNTVSPGRMLGSIVWNAVTVRRGAAHSPSALNGTALTRKEYQHGEHRVALCKTQRRNPSQRRCAIGCRIGSGKVNG